MLQLPSPELTPYELMVKRNIEENRRILQSLGFLDSSYVERVRKSVPPKRRVSVETPRRENVKFSPHYERVRTRRSSTLLDTSNLEDFSALVEVDGETPQKRSKVILENVFGEIAGVKVGDWWMTRMECSAAGVHRPTVAGISGRASEGCYSLALSGGYEDDIDCGDYFTYTGSGGRDLKGTKSNPKNLRTAPQSKDQVFDGVNAALALNVETKKPVRVIRGYKLPGPYAPEEGYRYDGLYSVEKCWEAAGLSGFKVCKFALKRLPHQDPPPWYNPLLLNTRQRDFEDNVPVLEADHSQEAHVVSPSNKKCNLSYGLSVSPNRNEEVTPPIYEEIKHNTSPVLIRRLSPRTNENTPESLTARTSCVSPIFNAEKEVKRKSPLNNLIDKENVLKIDTKDGPQDVLGSLQNCSLNTSKSNKISIEDVSKWKDDSLISNTITSSNEEQQMNDKIINSHLLPLPIKKMKLSIDHNSLTPSKTNETTTRLKISGSASEVNTLVEYSSKMCVFKRQEQVNKDITSDVSSKPCCISSGASSCEISEVSTTEHVSKFTEKTSDTNQTDSQSSIKRLETDSLDSVSKPSGSIQNASINESVHDSTPKIYHCPKSSCFKSPLKSAMELNSPVKKVRFSPQVDLQDLDGNSSSKPLELCIDDSFTSSADFKGFDEDSKGVFKGFDNTAANKGTADLMLESDRLVDGNILHDVSKRTSFNGSPVYPKALRSNRLFSSTPLASNNKSENLNPVGKTQRPRTSVSPVNTSSSSDSSVVKDCQVVVEKLDFEETTKTSSPSKSTPNKVANSKYQKWTNLPFPKEVLHNRPRSLAVQPTSKLSPVYSLIEQNREKRRLYEAMPRKRHNTMSELLRACKPCSVVLIKTEPSFQGFDGEPHHVEFPGFDTKDIERARKKSCDLKDIIYKPSESGFAGWESAQRIQGSSALVRVGFIIEKLSESRDLRVETTS